ncbi:capsular polysaccharide synthesis protein [Segatella hominis]|uniref:capsular polysaccharide synthesis protein n=1 Tax=Segatella hominis TaxID=2518605 RepID=UPI00142FF808|nr:capsular polysaccharide synthesis protein [Segatella hominis]
MASQRKHLPDYEFRVFDLSNYQQWIELPEFIVRKYKKGLIPAASFSDLLRLSLLQKYGGVWMDATVFCSGFGNEKLQGRWNRIMQSELTVFRYLKRGVMAPVGLSNWFIAAVPHQIVISSVLDMLLAYWKDYNCLVDYYIIHLFLGLSLCEFPMVEARMPRENSYHSILLGDALGRTFHQEQWRDLINHVSIHKLNYRKVGEVSKNPRGYYWYIVS